MASRLFAAPRGPFNYAFMKRKLPVKDLRLAACKRAFGNLLIYKMKPSILWTVTSETTIYSVFYISEKAACQAKTAQISPQKTTFFIPNRCTTCQHGYQQKGVKKNDVKQVPPALFNKAAPVAFNSLTTQLYWL